MQLSQKQIFVIGAGALLFIIVAVVVFLNMKSTNQPEQASLKLWVPLGNKAYWDEAVKAYGQFRPNVQIEVQEFGAESYEAAVVDALAGGFGPDVFMIHSRALPLVKSRLSPAGATQFSVGRLRQLFPTVVEQDFVSGGQVYALPLYLDTLALLYNRNLFDQAKIIGPPQTWSDFQKVVPYLRTLNTSGQLTRAGAAIGGSEKSVAWAADIVSLIMMQYGAPMTNISSKNVAFAGQAGSAGYQAFNFYLQF
ncbi:MAG: extracellular solute-binding protein, partial [Patescibacteria group bacterium]